MAGDKKETKIKNAKNIARINIALLWSILLNGRGQKRNQTKNAKNIVRINIALLWRVLLNDHMGNKGTKIKNADFF